MEVYRETVTDDVPLLVTWAIKTLLLVNEYQDTGVDNHKQQVTGEINWDINQQFLNSANTKTIYLYSGHDMCEME